MRSSALSFIFLASFSLVAVTASCKLGSRLLEAAETPPSPALTPTTASRIPPIPSPTLLSTPEDPSSQITPSPPPTNTPAALDHCSAESCTNAGYFLLERPIGATGRNTIDHSNRFGSYRKNTSDTHHGVDFLNSTGTPVLAAADGVVIVAGNDSDASYALYPNFYGNLVVLKHTLPELSQPIYTLYAHLSQVSIKVDEAVKAGQEIGLVGMTGRVTGSTLHFEVRLGENTYQAARNPELWLVQLPDETGQLQGALAGRVLDAQGNTLQVLNIVIERLGDPGQPAIDQIYLKTYAEKRLIGLSPWEESFAAGDLPAGPYQISFWLNELQQLSVQVLPGKLTLVTFQIK